MEPMLLATFMITFAEGMILGESLGLTLEQNYSIR